MKVAITQETIGGGGRIAVIIEMISVLNELDIIPDIITFRMNISKEEIRTKYGKSIEFNLIEIGPNIKKLEEFRIVWFNFLIRKYQKNYSFIIDSNNTTCLLSKAYPVFSYIYYPRKDRVFRRKSIHEKDYNVFHPKKRLGQFIDKLLTRPIYFLDSLKSIKTIITLSEFSKNAILSRYNVDPASINVIYPPVDITPYKSNKNKENSVATIGRFAPSKRQLTQIKIAQKLPELIFHIMGFARTDDPYFIKCKRYISENNIKNVQLYPSINFNQLKDILESSKFFLHTLTNEPFGITTVQGIAAGCIPVVPDSGGQREVVPNKELRFSNIDQAIEIFRELEKASTTEITTTLKNHIKRFETKSFKNQFLLEIRNIILKLNEVKNET